MIDFQVFLLGLSTDGWAQAALALSAVTMGADVWLTSRGLKLGLTEMNPMIRGLMEKLGVLPALVGSKLFVLLVSLVAAGWVASSDSGHWYVVATLAAAGVVHIPVVIWNYRKTR